MNKFWESKWVYRLLSLVLALGIFFYVNTKQVNNTRQSGTANSSLLATRSATVKVPLQLNADTTKYFITGYPQNVKVRVSGSSALVTAVKNTQNFRVVANLSQLGVGKHRVKLTEEGLNRTLNYKISPATITVNIQKRVNRTMPIEVKYNVDALADGYEVGTPKLSTNSVRVSGSREEIKRINKVVATVALSHNTRKDVTQTVSVQAVDSNGDTLNVIVLPETVKVMLPVSLPSKKVGVEFKQTGSVAKNRAVTLKSSTDSVRIYGSRSVLAKLDTLTLPVEVSNVTSSTTKTVRVTNIYPNLVNADPNDIKVNLKVTTENSSEAGEVSAASSAASSDSASSASVSSSSSSSSSAASSSTSSSVNSSSSSGSSSTK
ncbi:CdaR family protein [Lacticaseibacillus thailandensis]|uniref:YbbR like protein n=1 Tax=Lacticaseibacillus thailandensis DSM 22698 = JCM 13996 TaxID=1423810 RepID=A0A0R2C977_9LACO|nr:CdaR family protein [Lacticaseibacillus thailandensis]KRM88349.1 YbbR like protein [Lacticaseibacillus thailandensis DSM 22698 = JCM 13996]